MAPPDMPRASASDVARVMKVAQRFGMSVEVRPDGTIAIVPVREPDIAAQQAPVAQKREWVP